MEKKLIEIFPIAIKIIHGCNKLVWHFNVGNIIFVWLFLAITRDKIVMNINICLYATHVKICNNPMVFMKGVVAIVW